MITLKHELKISRRCFGSHLPTEDHEGNSIIKTKAEKQVTLYCDLLQTETQMVSD
jgi:hypothetical protein